MSKKLIYAFAFLGAIAAFAPACGDSDPCKDVVCVNGDCFEGACICNQGYEEDAEGKCTVMWQTKFVGTYNTAESCDGTATGNYSNTVSAGADNFKLVISNFGDSGLNMVADITASNEINIPVTNLSVGGTTYQVSGSGTISGTVMTITYTAKENGVTQFTCTMTMTKV